jgi:Fibronectin type III domain
MRQALDGARPRIVHPSREGRHTRRRVALAVALSIGLGLLATGAAAQTAADSSVTLLWTAPGDDGNVGTASQYALRYRTVPISGTDTLTWWNAATPASGLPTPRPAGSTDSVTVRSLQPLTTYYFIIRAADEVPNWSGFSNVAVKTTSGDATPPAAVADLTVTGATGTSLSLRWTAPGDDGATGTAASYDIRYSTSPITNGNWSNATSVTGEPAPTAAGTQQTFTIPGLSGSRTYYVALKTTDDVGNLSSLSNVASGTTTDTVAPAPVRDLSLNPDGEPLNPAVIWMAAEVEIAYVR